MHDGLIAESGLAPDGCDPGQKGVTRYLRLPEGCNTKQKRIDENNGIPPCCEIIEWRPDLRYKLDDLAKPFDINLDTPRKIISGDLTDIPEHPILNNDFIKVKKRISTGRYDVTCPWVSEHTDGIDDGSAVFTNADNSIGFKCHHGSCEHRTGKHLLEWLEEKESGFSSKMRSWQALQSFSNINQSEFKNSPFNQHKTALAQLLDRCANGESAAMKKQMKEDKFILKGLAIQGQWTVFYAGPNTGKTLLTLWMLREVVQANEINGELVIYVNYDDTYKGGVEKLQIAEEAGFNMLLPNGKGFNKDSLIDSMKGMIAEVEALGVILILDTLKKFTDLMSKSVASQFGEVARTFVSAGGSIICLAHTNKYKDENGKSVYSGTTDIRDNADCVYTIELLESVDGFCETTNTVEFECNKSRGDVAQKMMFQYTKEKGGGYRKLFDSVKRLDEDDMEKASKSYRDQQKQRIDEGVIEVIKTAIVNGHTKKTDISKFVCNMSDFSRRNTVEVLECYEGRLWTVEKGEKNSSIYSLLLAPNPPVIT